ncbi:thiamine pyrophosphate-binding protein [Caproiciproducens sp. R2]|uniref:thiamine pyrophosphate-binding protein n=1 Tax=Caproiciproducens sp. R2 TaxID=3435187 RepID=UPI0040343F51
MKLSDYIAEFLAEYGCTYVFGYQGGAVTHLVDSLYRRSDLRFIAACNEQGAAFAAEGYARVRNDIGVAVATSGPGATNLITGIGSAYFDSIPCLYLTGQVNTYEYKGDLPIRQRGFQETDIVSVAAPVVKYAVRITDPKKIRYELEKAVHIANSGRKGPVLLDIPMDVQRAEVDARSLEEYEAAGETDESFSPEKVVEYFRRARRPVLLAGGGVRLSGAQELFSRFAETTGIPVVSSLMGRDAYDGTHDNYFGMIGVYGNRCANLAVANSDLILALGTRLDTRQTGTNVSSFARGARLIRVDIDGNELGRKVKEDEVAIAMDAGRFLAEMRGHIHQIPEGEYAYGPWIERVKGYRKRYPFVEKPEMPDPNYILSKISAMTEENDILCLDVGQNQMWAAQSMTVRKGQRMLISGGMGAMGFSLPAAIGASFGKRSGGAVLSINGDGGLQMNIQELETVKRNRIPVKIIVMNNRCLGMIRHFQEQYFENRFCATVKDYEAPDFCRIAKAYGIAGVRVETLEELLAVRPLLESNDPVLIDIRLEQNTQVWPKLSVSRPIEDQEPLLPRTELAENMLIRLYDGGGGNDDAPL